MPAPGHSGGGGGKPRSMASSERELLRNRIAWLQELKRWTVELGATDGREQIRVEAIQVAIEHVQAAIDALEVASRE